MAEKKPRRAKSELMKLTDKQEAFVEARSLGVKAADAGIAAGFSPNGIDSSMSDLEKIPSVRERLSQKYRMNQYMLGLTREQVLQGMMDAIDDAKTLSEPLTQIAGWREIAKICGFYAPEIKKVELSATGKQAVDRLRALSDEELLQIAEGDVIDVEFKEE